MAPGYADIAGQYRERILNGGLSPGDSMPSLSEGVALHGVNRTTMVRAYEVLRQEGLIASQPGRGTVVTRRPRVVVTGAQRATRLDSGGPDLATGETVSNRAVADCTQRCKAR